MLLFFIYTIREDNFYKGTNVNINYILIYTSSEGFNDLNFIGRKLRREHVKGKSKKSIVTGVRF